MNISACIFDLDGVLCDTSKFHFAAWSATAKSLNVAFEEEDNHQLKGVSRKNSLEYILEKGGITLDQARFDKCLKEKNEHYISLIESLGPTDINPGVKDLFEELSKNDIKIGLGSSSKNARMVVEKLGLTKYFLSMVDGTDVTRTKPDPETFLKGAAQLGVQPTQIIVFEDAPKGAQAAKTGGFWCIGVGGEELEGIADIIVADLEHTYSSLLSLLKSIPNE